jgi:sulfite exporter TauE/SafE
MLGSITPLGQRGRGGSWGSAVAVYIVASTVGGLLLGLALGALGGATWNSTPGDGLLRIYGIALVTAAGVVAESVWGIHGLPSFRRQVNENWLVRYRSWVWATGFGSQLGLGVVTIVTTSAIYAAWWSAFVSASALHGSMIGAAFGLSRSVVSMAVFRVDRPQRIVVVDRTITRFAQRSKWASWTLQLTVVGIAVLIAQ